MRSVFVNVPVFSGNAEAGRITGITHTKSPSTKLLEQLYGYDAAGNRLYAKNTVDTGRSHRYTYDDADRLLTFTGSLYALNDVLDGATAGEEITYQSDKDYNNSLQPINPVTRQVVMPEFLHVTIDDLGHTGPGPQIPSTIWAAKSRTSCSCSGSCSQNEGSAFSGGQRVIST